MKPLKIGELEIKVCEHQGDINYLRFVKFKQYAPQFWEKMDSPLFAMAFEKFLDLHNQGKYVQSAKIWYDYQLSIKQAEENSFDAWGICFALITLEPGESEITCPDDIQLRAKLKRMTDQGLNAQTVKTEVINFMKVSPVEFAEHLILYVNPYLRGEAGN